MQGEFLADSICNISSVNAIGSVDEMLSQSGVAPGGLKYGFQGIVNAKNLRQNSFSSSGGGLACSDMGAIAPSSPPLALPLVTILLSKNALQRLVQDALCEHNKVTF